MTRRPERQDRKQSAGLYRPASATLLLSMLALLSACGGADTPPPTDADRASQHDGADADAPDEDIDLVEPTVTPLAQSGVRLYFPSESGDGLTAEDHAIFETTTPGDRAKQIVAALIEGPEGGGSLRALPRGTRLRQAYVLSSGVAYLDFSRELVEGLGGGSMRELLTVYSIVDSVVRNVPEITSVGLLIDGNIPETLNGHLDLRYPLRPNYSVLLQAQAEPDAAPATDPPLRVAGNQ